MSVTVFAYYYVFYYLTALYIYEGTDSRSPFGHPLFHSLSSIPSNEKLKQVLFYPVI